MPRELHIKEAGGWKHLQAPSKQDVCSYPPRLKEVEDLRNVDRFERRQAPVAGMTT